VFTESLPSNGSTFKILIVLNPREHNPSEPSNRQCDVKAEFHFVPCCGLFYIPAIKCEVLSSILQNTAMLLLIKT
jgi:hypothetical protein